MKSESISLATGMSTLPHDSHPLIQGEAKSTRCEGLAGKRMVVPDDGFILGDSTKSSKSLSILDDRLEECDVHEFMSQSIDGNIFIDMAFLLQMDDEMDDYASEDEDDGDLYSCARDSIVLTKERREIKARDSEEESPNE